MTIASEISRITGLRNRIRTKLVSLGLLQGGDRALNDLAACTTAIEGIGGTQNITTLNTYDVAAKDKAKVVDSNLVPGNIVSGVSILGVVGTASVSPPAARLQERTVLYGGENAPNTLVPSSGYDGISKVNFERTDANPTLVAANIRNGVKIMGVTGTYGQLQSKNVALGAAMPSTVSPATGYTGLSQVTFTKDTGVVKADNIKNGVQILGVTGSYETPTESKSVLLGADYPPAAVTPSAGKHLSSVAFSMNSNLFKAENIKAGVTLLGVTGTYGGGGDGFSVDFLSTGYPMGHEGEWDYTRDTVSIDLSNAIETVDDIVCFLCYNQEIETHPLSSFWGKVASIVYTPFQKESNIVKSYTDPISGQTDYFIEKDSSLTIGITFQNGGRRLLFAIRRNGSLEESFMGAYRFLICYRSSTA